MYQFKTVIHRSGVTGEILTVDEVRKRLKERGSITITLSLRGGEQVEQVSGLGTTQATVGNVKTELQECCN